MNKSHFIVSECNCIYADLTAMIHLLTKLDIGVTREGLHQAKLNKFDKLKKWSSINIDKYYG